MTLESCRSMIINSLFGIFVIISHKTRPASISVYCSAFGGGKANSGFFFLVLFLVAASSRSPILFDTDGFFLPHSTCAYTM